MADTVASIVRRMGEKDRLLVALGAEREVARDQHHAADVGGRIHIAEAEREAAVRGLDAAVRVARERSRSIQIGSASTNGFVAGAVTLDPTCVLNNTGAVLIIFEAIALMRVRDIYGLKQGTLSDALCMALGYGCQELGKITAKGLLWGCGEWFVGGQALRFAGRLAKGTCALCYTAAAVEFALAAVEGDLGVLHIK